MKPRLKVIAEMLPRCSLVCDIGTDHAYLPIYILKKNISQRVVVTEISQGPLSKAQKNIKEKHLQNRIEAILGDGLKALDNSVFIQDNNYEDYAIVVAGMGGILIKRILEEGNDYIRKAKALILQPMSRMEIVYEWLIKEGFEVFEQRLVKDDNRIYNVLAARWTGMQQRFKPIDLYIGKKLIEKRDPLLKEYTNWKISILNKIITNLQNYRDQSQKKDNSGYLARLIDIRDEMNDILEYI